MTKRRAPLVGSVVVTILFFFPTGLVALWFSVQARAATDPAQGDRAAVLARRWVIVSVVIGVVMWAVIVAGLLLLGATNPFAG